jgi:hypothetical protein
MKILGLLFFLGLFFHSLLVAQTTIQGRVMDKNTQQAIPYANIGVLKSNIGTISNPDGTFQIIIPAKLHSDSLTFSALGFEKQSFLISSLTEKQILTVFLVEKIIALQSVTIAQKKVKNKTFELGNDSFKGGVLEEDTTYAGRSIALLIENKAPNFHQDLQFPVYLRQASLRIFRNNLPHFKFRIRLNKLDKITGQPGEDLLEQSIVKESNLRNGWLEFDLSVLNYLIYEPFFVTFEQILDLNDRTLIADGYRNFMLENPKKIKIDTVEFEGEKVVRRTLQGNAIDLPGTFIAINSSESAAKDFSCYVRETSLAPWKKVRGIVTAKVILSNQASKIEGK